MGTCVPSINVSSKNKKNIKKNSVENFHFNNFKNICILHGHVFVMVEFKFCCVKMLSWRKEKLLNIKKNN